MAKTSKCDRERLLDSELPEAAQTAVSEHVETCAACREQLESFAAGLIHSGLRLTERYWG